VITTSKCVSGNYQGLDKTADSSLALLIRFDSVDKTVDGCGVSNADKRITRRIALQYVIMGLIGAWMFAYR